MGLVTTDVSKEPHCGCLLVAVNIVSSSPILSTLKMEKMFLRIVGSIEDLHGATP
jgi:hypothetical protein